MSGKEKLWGRFDDFYDYIVKITYEIWESRGVEKIRDYYGRDMKLHTPDGMIVGAEKVVLNTYEMLNQFPDRRLLPEDVVWDTRPGKEHGRDGTVHYSSHRLLSTMNHQGKGAFGNPTGKQVVIRTVADCAVQDGVIFEEWLVRDRVGLMMSLGLDVEEQIGKMAAAAIADGSAAALTKRAAGVKEGVCCETEGKPLALAYANTLKDIWHGELGKFSAGYHEACRIETSLNRTLYGHESAHRNYFRYLSCFSDCVFSVDNLVELHEPGMPARVSVRWSLSARHEGFGPFGEPTGGQIYILGINQAFIAGGKVFEEWAMIDEAALMKQVRIHQFNQQDKK